MKRRCKLCGEVVCGEDFDELKFRFNNHDCIADPTAYTFSDEALVERITRERSYSNKIEEGNWDEQGCFD